MSQSMQAPPPVHRSFYTRMVAPNQWGPSRHQTTFLSSKGKRVMLINPGGIGYWDTRHGYKMPIFLIQDEMAILFCKVNQFCETFGY